MTNDADKLSRALVRMFEGMSRPERRALLHACKHVIPHSVQQELTESGMPLRGNFFLNRQPMEDPTPALTASHGGAVDNNMALTFSKLELKFKAVVSWELAESDWENNGKWWLGLFREVDGNDKDLGWTWLWKRADSYEFPWVSTGTLASANFAIRYHVRLILTADRRTYAWGDKFIICAAGMMTSRYLETDVVSRTVNDAVVVAPNDCDGRLSADALEVVAGIAKLPADTLRDFCFQTWRQLSRDVQQDVSDLMTADSPAQTAPPPADESIEPAVPTLEAAAQRTITLSVKERAAFTELSLVYALPSYAPGDEIVISYIDNATSSSPTEREAGRFKVTSLSKEEKLSAGKLTTAISPDFRQTAFDAHYLNQGRATSSSRILPYFIIDQWYESRRQDDYFLLATYSKADAKACAELSSLAYDFTDLGDSLGQLHDRRLDLFYILERPGYNTQAFLARSGDRKDVYVVFRGSQEWEDWYHNMTAFSVATFHGYLALATFVRRYEDAATKIRKKIEEAISSGANRIFFAGHSLGAALAQMCAIEYTKRLSAGLNIRLYTFGGPPCLGLSLNTAVNDLLTAYSKTFGSFNIVDVDDLVAKGFVSLSQYLGYYRMPYRLEFVTAGVQNRHGIANYIDIAWKSLKG